MFSPYFWRQYSSKQYLNFNTKLQMQKRRQQAFPSSLTEKSNYLQSLKLKYTQDSTYNPTLYNTKTRDENLNNLRKLSTINQYQTEKIQKPYTKISVLNRETSLSQPYQNYKSMQRLQVNQYENYSNYGTARMNSHLQEATLNVKKQNSPVGKIRKLGNRLSYQRLPPKYQNQQPEEQNKFDSPIKLIYDDQKQNTKRQQPYRSRSCFGQKETSRTISTKRQTQRMSERQKDMSAITKVDNILQTIRRTLAI